MEQVGDEIGLVYFWPDRERCTRRRHIDGCSNLTHICKDSCISLVVVGRPALLLTWSIDNSVYLFVAVTVALPRRVPNRRERCLLRSS